MTERTVPVGPPVGTCPACCRRYRLTTEPTDYDHTWVLPLHPLDQSSGGPWGYCPGVYKEPEDDE